MTDHSRDRAEYCIRCGERLDLAERFGRPRPTCGACGLIWFQPTSNAGVCVVAHRRRVLLVERAISPYRGCWGFPGGFQEYGESLAETAGRETREETGLEVRVSRVLRVGFTRDDPRKLVNVAIFLAHPAIEPEQNVDAMLRPADDAAAARFFGFDELPPMCDIAFENNQRVLRDLLEQFPNGDIR